MLNLASEAMDGIWSKDVMKTAKPKALHWRYMPPAKSRPQKWPPTRSLAGTFAQNFADPGLQAACSSGVPDIAQTIEEQPMNVSVSSILRNIIDERFPAGAELGREVMLTCGRHIVRN